MMAKSPKNAFRKSGETPTHVNKKSRLPSPSHEVQLVLDSYPDKLWSSQRKFNNFYIADGDVASEIAKVISHDQEKDIFIFEANPGPGVLTKALLESSFCPVRAFEKEAGFIPKLKELQKQYPNTLDIVEEDIMLLPKLEAKAKFYDDSSTKAIFKDVKKREWKNGVALKIVSVVTNSKCVNFLRYVLARLPSMSSLFCYGRCQFFLLVSDLEFSRMMARPKGNMTTYRDVTVMYNLFFEVKSFKSIPLSAFVPLPGSHRKKTPQNMYLVCLTPKRDLLDTVSSPHLLPELYFFIRHHFMKRKSYVIPTLEQWIPWCGPKFIKKGMRVFTRFGDLSPQQILQLFQQFSSLPEYEDSPFRAAVEHFFEHKEHQVS